MLDIKMRWLPTPKAAESVGCSRTTLRRWATAGRIQKPRKLTDGLTFWAVPDDAETLPKSRLMNVGETAQYLGIHRTTLWRLANQGIIPEPETGFAGVPGWRQDTLNAFFERLPPL